MNGDTSWRSERGELLQSQPPFFFLTPPFFLSSLTSHSSCPTRIKCSNPHWTGSATCVELKASRRARSRVTSCTRQLPEKGSGFLWFFVQLVIDVQQKARIVNPSLSPPPSTALLVSKGQFDCQGQEEDCLTSMNPITWSLERKTHGAEEQWWCFNVCTSRYLG